jgi:hypothetical protein
MQCRLRRAYGGAATGWRASLRAGLGWLSLVMLWAGTRAQQEAPLGSGGGEGQRPALAIFLPNQKVVSAPLLRLGDLAVLSGPEELVERCGALVVGQAPLPGRSRAVTRGYLKMRLRAAGLCDRDFEFDGAEVVQVERAGSAAGSGAGAVAPTPRPPGSPPDLAVGRGEALLVRACFGLVEVRAEATALEPGRVGETIWAQIKGGRQKILVRVTGPHTAEVSR